MKLPFIKKITNEELEDQAHEPVDDTMTEYASSTDVPEADVEQPRRSRFWWRAILPVLLLGLLFSTVVVFYLSGQQSDADNRLLALLDANRVSAQSMAKETAAASQSKDLSPFKQLDNERRQFERAMAALATGNRAIRVEALPDVPEVREAYGQLVADWKAMHDHVNTLLRLRAVNLKFADAIFSYESAEENTIVYIDRFIKSLTDAYAPSVQLLAAVELKLPVERIGEGMLRARADAQSDAMENILANVAAVRERITGFENGAPALGIQRVEDPTARNSLHATSTQFGKAEAVVEWAQRLVPELVDFQTASAGIFTSTEAVSTSITALQVAYSNYAETRNLQDTGFIMSGAVALMLILFVLQLTNEATRRAEQERQAAAQARQREEQTRIVNQDNQEAILRLLDEIADLADGDLTITATVTEDITGAIADAINFSIDALRETVVNINGVSVEMASAARRARDRVEQLTQASETQSTKIEGAVASIRSLADASRTVSADAERVRDVASQSVDYANDGANAVRATIDGMDSIRENIQETSKRIKRLGESSQEIGDIVGLIDDIADQTNILALNAAIQASMAGEQGRGFAVVADEVQRLAERASQATKQIDGLVKAIQSDTNEAVASMERSTSGVVSGAGLAEDAGQALVRIEIVSQELAGLISGISESSTGQTEQAVQVNEVMEEIQRITAEARSGTRETGSAIGSVAQLAVDLRTSVAGFRLPETIEPSTVIGLPALGDTMRITIDGSPKEILPQAAHGI